MHRLVGIFYQEIFQNERYIQIAFKTRQISVYHFMQLREVRICCTPVIKEANLPVFVLTQQFHCSLLCTHGGCC